MILKPGSRLGSWKPAFSQEAFGCAKHTHRQRRLYNRTITRYKYCLASPCLDYVNAFYVAYGETCWKPLMRRGKSPEFCSKPYCFRYCPRNSIARLRDELKVKKLSKEDICLKHRFA